MTEELITGKSPTFDGKAKNFPVFNTKLTSYVARKGCGELLRWTQDVPLDTETLDPNDADEAKKIEIRKQNSKAAGILLDAITTEGDEGLYAFDLVEQHVDAQAGYAAGNFVKAWAALKKHYETRDEVSKVDYEKEYFKMEMGKEEYPPIFIRRLDKQRKLMNKNMVDPNRKVDDNQFLLHILNSLPKGDDGNLGPYQLQSEIVLQKMEAGNYDLDHLTMDLTRIYNKLYGEYTKKDDEDSKKGDVGLPAFGKQPKTKCRQCGKWHKGKCLGKDYKPPKRNNNNNNNKGNNKSGGRKFLTGVICHGCKKEGHIQRWCPNKSNNDEGEVALMCFETDEGLPEGCMEVNHIEDGSVSDSFFDAFETDSQISSWADIESDQELSDIDSSDEQAVYEGAVVNEDWLPDSGCSTTNLKWADLSDDQQEVLKESVPYDVADYVIDTGATEQLCCILRKLQTVRDAEAFQAKRCDVDASGTSPDPPGAFGPDPPEAPNNNTVHGPNLVSNNAKVNRKKKKNKPKKQTQNNNTSKAMGKKKDVRAPSNFHSSWRSDKERFIPKNANKQSIVEKERRNKEFNKKARWTGRVYKRGGYAYEERMLHNRQRIRDIELKGYRYKGSKQLRDHLGKQGRQVQGKKKRNFNPNFKPSQRRRPVNDIKVEACLKLAKLDDCLKDNYYAVLPVEEPHPGYYLLVPVSQSRREGISRSERKKQKQEKKKRAKKNKARRERRRRMKFKHQTVDTVFNVTDSDVSFDRDTWLGDSGASTFMGNTDEGMFDVKEINEPVTIGNGKTLRATKIGKLRRTVHQTNGDTLDIIIPDYKHVPELHVNLFSITKALELGWKLTNKGVMMILNKNGRQIRFDRIYKTDNGKLCGVNILPRFESGEMAFPAESGKAWDINRMHRVFNHASEEVLRATAKDNGWQVTGTFETCRDCHESNAKQKGVAKSTETKSDKPGERLFMDFTSIKSKSLGGGKFWLVVVDDATNLTWSYFLKKKNKLAKTMVSHLLQMKASGTKVKAIRCDNAGENRKLEDECKKLPDLAHIKFEYTPRDSPQYNGKCERKIAVLTGRVRSVLTAARLPQKLRERLWAEAASHVTDVENLLMSKTYNLSAYKACNIDTPKAEMLRQFGEMGIIKWGPSIKGKLTNRGLPIMYLGRAKNHAGDTHRMLNINTLKVLISRDAIWLNQVYGEYKGDKRITDVVTVVPSKSIPKAAAVAPADAQQPPPQPPQQQQQQPIQAAPTRHTRSSGPPQLPTAGNTNSNAAEIRKLIEDAAAEINRNTRTITERVLENNTAANDQSRREDLNAIACTAVDSLVLIDRFGGDFEELADDLALTAAEAETDPSKIDPSKYKDIFENPKTFDEAWNHPDPFQRKKWRGAITLEFSKMNEKKVWKKIKRSEKPKDRRCVKYKWVFEIKRDGRFRARLVACGYSQVAGVDFNEVYSPVANDVTCRLLLIYSILNGLDTMIYDVQTAFLHGTLSEEIYMECPEGMEHEEDEILLLLKTIYGLVQASAEYYRTYKTTMEKIGFEVCPVEPCLFKRKRHGKLHLVSVHIDDNLSCADKKSNESILKELPEAGLKVTSEDTLDDYLGGQILFNKDRTMAWIGQPHMIKKLAKTFGEEVSKLQKYKTPGTPGQGLVMAKDEEEMLDGARHSRFRTGTGMLLYCVKVSRPLLANPVRELSKVLSKPNEAAYKEMLRIIKYTLDTPGHGIKVKPELDNGYWTIEVYTDSDWSGCKDSRKSVTGYMIFVCGVLVAFKSRSQKAIALSSSEAEFYALSEAVKEIPFIVQMLLFMEVKIKLPIIVRVDNMGAVYMAESATASARTRHMDTRHRYVNSLQEQGLIKVVFVRSGLNKADPATKNTTVETFEAHAPSLEVNKDDIVNT